MTAQDLGALLLVGYGAVGVVFLYAFGAAIVRGFRARSKHDKSCPDCNGTGLVQPRGGVYWRCTSCDGRGDQAVAA